MLRSLLAVVLLVGWVPPGANLHFSAEDQSVRNPVEMPKVIWSLLEQDPDVQEVAATQGSSINSPLKTWFSAARVRLSARTPDDFVVQGEGPIMGANVTTFWVFAGEESGSKLLLKVPAHDLVIREERASGYKVIEATSVIAGHVSTLIYRFNGNQYVARGQR